MNDLNNSNVMVTGSHGHIGSYIVEWITKLFKNVNIICVDNMYNGDERNLDKAKELAKQSDCAIVEYTVDISRYGIMDDLFDMHNIQYVFHQASMLTLDAKEDRLRAVQVNIVGTTNIFELCIRYDCHLVYASSASVYGNPHLFPTTESHDFNNCKLLYGATKVADEYLARSWADEEGLRFLGLRYFNVYGERQSTKNVYTQIVPKWINAIMDGDPITIYGDGMQTMDMIHGDDVGMLNVKAMQKGLMRKGGFDGFMNICTCAETSVIGLYGIIDSELDRMGIENNSEILYENHDPNLVSKRKGDNQLMTKHIGRYSISVPEGMRRTIHAIVERRNS